jgi:hypothetical protein
MVGPCQYLCSTFNMTRSASHPKPCIRSSCFQFHFFYHPLTFPIYGVSVYIAFSLLFLFTLIFVHCTLIWYIFVKNCCTILMKAKRKKSPLRSQSCRPETLLNLALPLLELIHPLLQRFNPVGQVTLWNGLLLGVGVVAWLTSDGAGACLRL